MLDRIHYLHFLTPRIGRLHNELKGLIWQKGIHLLCIEPHNSLDSTVLQVV